MLLRAKDVTESASALFDYAGCCASQLMVN